MTAALPPPSPGGAPAAAGDATAAPAAAPQASPGPGSPPRLRRETAIGAALAALYAALAAWWLWPLPLRWADSSLVFERDLPLAVADFHLIAWILAWDVHALLGQPLRLFDANAFHPAPLSLAFSEHLLGALPLFAPTYLASGNPVLAVNVMTWLTYPLCAISAYALARRWLDPPAAALAGLLFAFHPQRYLAPPHVHLLGVQWLPLAILFTDRWLERARPRDAAALAGCLCMQALSSFYLAYALAFGWGAFLVAALVRWRRALDRRRLAGLAIAAALAAIPVALASRPYLVLQELGLIPRYGDPGAPAAMALLPYFGTRRVVRALTEEGIGVVGYGLALAALVPPLGRRAWPVAAGGVLAAVGLVVSLGPTALVAGRHVPLPYRLLLDVVPGLGSVRMPARFVVVVQLGLALLAAAGFARLAAAAFARAGDRPAALARWAAAAVAALAVLWTFRGLPPLPLAPEPVGDEIPAAYRWLAESGAGGALLELPAGGPAESARRMHRSTVHWLPIVDGYAAYPPPTVPLLHGIARRLPGEAALQELVDAVDLRWILVHEDGLSEASRRAWEAPPPGLSLAARWPGARLFRVERDGDVERRRRLVSVSETLDGAPLAPLGERCAGELRWRDAPPVAWRAGEEVTLSLELVNRGDRAWPVRSLYPRHTVRLHAVVVPVHDVVRAAAPAHAVASPGRDVAPGDVVAASVPMRAPRPPGDYRVRIELEQVGSGSLAGCGVAPLEIDVRVAAAPAAAPSSP